MCNNTTETYTLLQRYHTWTSVFQKFAPISVWTERLIPPIWYVIGLIGNPLSAIIWLRQARHQNNSSAVYLGVLSITHLLLLFLHLLYILSRAWGLVTYNRPLGCELFNFIFNMMMYFSDFLILGCTFDRYMAVCHPIMKLNLFTVRRTVYNVFGIIAISAALATAQIYIRTYSRQQRNCIIRPEAKSSGFAGFWTLVTNISLFVLIPLLVLVLNISILNRIFSIKKNEAMRQQQRPRLNSTTSTVTLLGVSFFFIITSFSFAFLFTVQIFFFPKGSIDLSDEEVQRDQTWARFFTYVKVEKVIEVLCLSQFACYSFIYCMIAKKFRSEFVYLLKHRRMMPVQYKMDTEQPTRDQNMNPVTSGDHDSEETHLATPATNV